MAKRGRKSTGAPYKKVAEQCLRELKEKKAALVRAEKTLAKAQRSHTELLSEVARLDMLDRSLKALINGTEPPQNVRYVYTYPQWVWYGNPYGWYWNGNNTYPNTYSITLGAQNPTYYTAQSGNLSLSTCGTQQFTTTNAINLANVTTCGSITSTADSGSSSLISNSSGISLDGGSGVFQNNSGSNPSWQNFQMTTSTPAPGVETVDLSTGAGSEPDPVNGAVEEVEETEEVVG